MLLLLYQCTLYLPFVLTLNPLAPLSTTRQNRFTLRLTSLALSMLSLFVLMFCSVRVYLHPSDWRRKLVNSVTLSVTAATFLPFGRRYRRQVKWRGPRAVQISFSSIYRRLHK